jgi:hypothetical protein
MELRRWRPVEPDVCALMVISDVELFDNPRRLTSLLERAGHQHIHLVVPKAAGRMDRHRWFHQATVHHFQDADQLGLIYGTVFAAMTGQRLEGRK